MLSIYIERTQIQNYSQTCMNPTVENTGTGSYHFSVNFYTPIISLYLTQRVAEGIMFLTRPSVSQSVRQSCFSCQRNSSETAQQNFVKLSSYEGHDV